MLFSHEPSIGNGIIDSEHKNLHDIINGIARIITAGEVAALAEAFEQLENGLCAYFIVEENIAQTLNFDFTQHKLAHQNLLKTFRRIKDELMAKNNRWSKFEKNDSIVYLRDCLIRHIKEDGKPLKAVLNTQLYGFKPN